MKLLQTSNRIQLTKPWTVSVHLTLALLLSSCGGGATDGALEEVQAPVESGPAASAAQLSNDTNYSIDFAQSVAAGFEDAPEPQTSNAPGLGAANADSAIPTADSSIAPVIFENVIETGVIGGEESSTNPTIGQGAALPENGSTPDETGGTDNTDSSNNTGNTDIENLEPIPTNGSPSQTPDSSTVPLTETEVTPSEGENTTGDNSGTDPDSNPTTDQVAPVEPEPIVTVNTNTDTEFFSSTTPGFNGEVLEDTIRVTWPVDPDARGYNVYRQAQFITSVFTEEYIDEDVHDSDYYYEIQAFDNDDRLYYIATGLTVKPRSFGTVDPDAPVPNNNLLDGYDLVFSDEFNGETLDATKWNTSYLWGTDLIINSEEQYYVDIVNEPDFGFNPFSFDGNNLTISSIETPAELSDKALNQPYLSGVITSYDAFKFTYGYVETRAKVTFGRGYWPAFWLLNAYYVDDKPEIDIMEFIGHDQDVVYHTYHYYDAEGRLRSTHSQPTPGVDYTSDFHTYAVEWKPGTIIFYIDNVEVHRVTDPKVSQQEMYVIANTALGGWWAGSPDESTPFPGEYTLDYIRVYQRSQPYDDVLFSDGLTQVPYADDSVGLSSPSHRPSIEDWPEGYPDGL